jgi:hypothetical protein
MSEFIVADLKNAISTHFNFIYSDPVRLESSIMIDPKWLLLSSKALDKIIEDNLSSAVGSFEKFCALKFAILIFTEKKEAIFLKKYIRLWINVSVYVGAYSYLIRESAVCFNNADLDLLQDNSTKMAVLRATAKAERNLGNLSNAIDIYKTGITIALDSKSNINLYSFILFLGKLYGNYLGQRSLFSLFVKEAYNNLVIEKKRAVSKDTNKIDRYIAICHDALGQAFRDSDLKLSEENFHKAYRLNKSANRVGGLSRNICHLSQLRFFNYASTDQQKLDQIQKFQEGIEYLKGDFGDERGLGVRYTQLGLMLNFVNKKEDAISFLETGKKLSKKYSDYKNLGRTSLIESAIYETKDAKKAIEVLEKGKAISEERKLHLLEAQINLKLAELKSKRTYFYSSSEESPIELYKRNRDIYVTLTEQIKNSLAQLSDDQTDLEFSYLGSLPKLEIKESLVLDYQNIVKELDSNLVSLTEALNNSERQRQELLTFQLVHSVARSILHEYKYFNNVDLVDSLSRINKSIQILSDYADDPLSSPDIKSVIAEMSTSLRDSEIIAAELGKTQEYLAKHLKRQKESDLDDSVSVSWACRQAVQDLANDLSSSGINVNLDISCDIIIRFNKDLVVVVIKNLIRNSLQEAQKLPEDSSDIKVSLFVKEDGDPLVENHSVMGILSISNRVLDKSNRQKMIRSLNVSLAENSTQKELGSGVGLDLTKLIFELLLGCEISVSSNKEEVGIIIKMNIGTDRIDLKTED